MGGCCKGNRQGESRAAKAILKARAKNSGIVLKTVNKIISPEPKLKPVEIDFINFLSEKRNEPLENIKSQYIKARKIYNTPSSAFKKYRDSIANMNAVVFGYSNHTALNTHYRALEAWWMLRFVGYAYNPEYCGLLAKLPEQILRANGKYPDTILEYGSGIALWAYQIAQVAKNKPKIYLLDIPGLPREFAKYRLEKIGCKVETIDVTDKQPNPWPLPYVDICIAWSVLEHLLDPVGATKNIMFSINEGGLLFSFLGEWKPEALHVNARSEEIKKLILTKFVDKGGWLYKRNF